MDVERNGARVEDGPLADQSSTSHAPVPLTILTGFLGAGKTTLVNHILQGDHSRNVAVLVNDFGSVNVDSDLIVGIEDNVISLANGCTCCSLREDLVETVLETLDGPHRPDHIVLEASGVAEPGGIAMAFNSASLQDRIRLDSVMCVVDAEQVFAYPGESPLTQLKLQQIAFADMVVLNKVGLAGPSTVAAVREWIDEYFNNIRVFETDFAHVPPEILLSVGRLEAERTGCELPDGVQQGHPEFDSWSFETSRPMSLDALHEQMCRLPGTVYRCKGIVHGAEMQDRASILQVVCRRVEITPGFEWSGEPVTKVVVISESGTVAPDRLQEIFDSCLAPVHPATAAG